jgi:hypothetical protein
VISNQLHKDYLGFDFELAGHKNGVEGLSFQQKRCIKAIFEYPLNPSSIPQLGYSKTTLNNDGSYRLINAQRRRAEALVLGAIFLKLDFESGRIGTPRFDGGFDDVSVQQLADISGLRIKFNDKGEYREDDLIKGVPQRFGRAYRSIIESGLITQVKQYKEVLRENKDGFKSLEKRAVNSLKILDTKLFVTLGALSQYELKGMIKWSAMSKIKTRTRKYERQLAASKSKAKIHQCKPKMSARVQRIMDNAFIHMLSLYRQLKKRFPQNTASWYRETVRNAYLT